MSRHNGIITMSRRESMKRRRKRQIIVRVLLSVIGICILIAAGLLAFSYSGRVYKNCEIEAGETLAAKDFLKNQKYSAEFADKDAQIDTSVPGKYKVKVKSGLFNYTCKVTVLDTIAPTGETKKRNVELGKAENAENFFVSITDKTKVTVSYEKEPDFNTLGEQTVVLKLTDAAGNTATYEEKMIVSPIRSEVNIEAGSIVDIQTFLLNQNGNAAFVSSLEEMNTNTVGDFDVEIQVDGKNYTSVLHVVDTVAPKVSFQDAQGYLTENLAPSKFIATAEDVTTLTYSFVTQPDMTKTEAQDITIKATDEGGNFVEGTVKVTLKADTEAPVFKGVQDIMLAVGEKPSYKKGVSVTDNCDTDIEFTVDNSKVDLETKGEYDVIYSAKDKAGNETSKTVKLTVYETAYTQETIDTLADAVLEKIFKEGMTQREQLTAIYNWVRSNIGYVNHTDKGDWRKAAYEAFTLHQGDCYAYASASKALLTRAGITNMDIEKIPTNVTHMWNLVDIGEGWYHFDACPRRGQTISFCYINDADLMAYSLQNDGSHNYDKNVYTDIK